MCALHPQGSRAEALLKQAEEAELKVQSCFAFADSNVC
jgi:hypothetical protein